MNKNGLVREIGTQIRAAKRILIVSHIRPDGDAIGSVLGLGLALQAAGKDVQMVLADGVPSSFRHLEGAQQIRNKPGGSFDFICTVDCADFGRTGESLVGYQQPDLNIDHHITNENFAKINLVDPHAVSTTEILADFISELGFPLTKPVAAALLTGLITDTLGFRTSNMTSNALRLAANLMDTGVDLPELYRLALIKRSFTATRLWGAGLTNLEREGRLVWTQLTNRDRASAGYSGRDDADLINILASIEEADISIIFVEQYNGKVKVSWRAQPGFDISPIATRFGGGGHPAASGAEIAGSLEEVKSKVLAETRPLLARA